MQAWHSASWHGRCRVAGSVSTFSMLPAALDSNSAVWDRPCHCLLEAVLGQLPLFHWESQDFHGKSWCCSRWLRRRFASFKAAKSAEFARTLKCQALLQSFMAMQAPRTHGHEGLKPRLWLRGARRLLRSLQCLMPVIRHAAMLDGSCLHELHAGLKRSTRDSARKDLTEYRLHACESGALSLLTLAKLDSVLHMPKFRQLAHDVSDPCSPRLSQKKEW